MSGPGKRAVRRAIARFDKAGCARCGRRSVLSMVVRTPTNKVKGVCPDCILGDDQIWSVGGDLDPSATPMAADRAFFEQHPGRNAYARRPYPDEITVLNRRLQLGALERTGTLPEVSPDCVRTADAVVVHQARPGARSRFPAIVGYDAQLAKMNRALEDWPALDADIDDKERFVANEWDSAMLLDLVAALHDKPGREEVTRSAFEARLATKH